MDAGDDVAKSLGVNTNRVRTLGMFFSSLITAVSISFLGIIGFVGLIAPQIMFRVNNRICALYRQGSWQSRFQSCMFQAAGHPFP